MNIDLIHADPDAQHLLTGIYPILNVYPETDVEALLEWGVRLPAAGIKLVQLRAKRIQQSRLPTVLDEVITHLKGAGLRVVLNDFVELVEITGADGVHLGLDDYPIVEARALLGHKAIIGATCRHHGEALMAVGQGATYVAAGAMFESSTKSSAPVIGVDVLRDIVRHIDEEAPARPGWGRRDNVPVCAIGGINKENLRPLFEAGASMVAIIFAIQDAKYPVKAARELIVEWDKLAHAEENQKSDKP